MGFRQIAVGVVRSDAGIAYISPRAIVDRAEEYGIDRDVATRLVGSIIMDAEEFAGPPILIPEGAPGRPVRRFRQVGEMAVEVEVVPGQIGRAHV